MLVHDPLEIGSASRTRTYDPLVNSQLLYQLSYRGSVVEFRLIVMHSMIVNGLWGCKPPDR